MAARSASGALGCVGGLVACAAVWSAGVALFGSHPGLWGWLGIIGAGTVAGSLVGGLLVSRRDRQWLKAVFLPEAERESVSLPWVLAILDGSSISKRGDDELAPLRQLPPVIRAELASSGKAMHEVGFSC